MYLLHSLQAMRLSDHSRQEKSGQLNRFEVKRLAPTASPFWHAKRGAERGFLEFEQRIIEPKRKLKEGTSCLL